MIKEQLTKLDDIVSQGAVVDAVKEFFADNATTSDHGQGGTTGDKAAMIAKMEGFTAGIAAVNGITFHGSLLDGNVSISEFTFDFNMKDGSKVFWHEMIKRNWNDEGKVIREEYFLT